MKLRLAIILLIAVAAAVAAIFINRKASTKEIVEPKPESRKADVKPAPVLVELFTSEGCSSCPPADEVLKKLEEMQQIEGAEVIALGQHVDYWNRLGWADPFSSAEFSARQNDYARAFGNDQIYTPQMVVDGRVEFVGSNLARAAEAIASAASNPKATVTINVAESATAKSDEIKLIIKVENIPAVSDGDTAEVILAITESGLQSSVSRGENAGRRLRHSAVTRSLSVTGKIDSIKESFKAESQPRIERDWKRDNLKVVIFIQERTSRRVLGAAAVPLNRR